MNDGGVLVVGLVHRQAQIANQVRLSVEARAVRERLDPNLPPVHRADADALAVEAQGEIGGHAGGRGPETTLVERDPQKLDGLRQPFVRRFLSIQNLEPGNPELQEIDQGLGFRLLEVGELDGKGPRHAGDREGHSDAAAAEAGFRLCCCPVSAVGLGAAGARRCLYCCLVKRPNALFNTDKARGERPRQCPGVVRRRSLSVPPQGRVD